MVSDSSVKNTARIVLEAFRGYVPNESIQKQMIIDDARLRLSLRHRNSVLCTLTVSLDVRDGMSVPSVDVDLHIRQLTPSAAIVGIAACREMLELGDRLMVGFGST